MASKSPCSASTRCGAVGRASLQPLLQRATRVRSARRLRGTVASVSPRDGSPLERLALTTRAELHERLESAKHAATHPPYASASALPRRVEALSALATALRRDSERLARMETVDMGKPLRDSRDDVATCAQLCDYYASIASRLLMPTPLAVPDAHFTSTVVPEPVGVVAAVTPWNYPLLQALVKVAPAIAAGCAVVLKPSPLASLTCLELERLVRSVTDLPDGALAVVTGGPPLESADESAAAGLLTDPTVDLLSFTGSSRGGKEMLRASAEQIRRTSVELGGKGAMLVFDDACVESVVDWAMVGIFSNAGQVCSATSRLLVERALAPRLLEALREATARLRVGDPLDEATQLGPLVSADAQHSVLAHISKTRSDGATLLCGGEKPELAPHLRGGFYVEPTVLMDVPVDSAAWSEEIFGPVLCVRTFDTEDEAVALANASPYGLAHAVMSADDERCSRVASRLEAGTVWANASQPVWPQTPFGGWKASGIGHEWGEAGMREFLRYKTFTRTRTEHSWRHYSST